MSNRMPQPRAFEPPSNFPTRLVCHEDGYNPLYVPSAPHHSSNSPSAGPHQNGKPMYATASIKINCSRWWSHNFHSGVSIAIVGIRGGCTTPRRPQLRVATITPGGRGVQINHLLFIDRLSTTIEPTLIAYHQKSVSNWLKIFILKLVQLIGIIIFLSVNRLTYKNFYLFFV
jgi:hypothetical protein